MKKIIGIILVVAIVLSSMSMLFVSAKEPIAPTLPDDVIAVLDEQGINNTLAPNGDWRPNWYEGYLVKRELNSVNLSNAEYIEFDVHYSDYDTFKKFIDDNGYDFTFNLCSPGENVWQKRAAVSLFNYGTNMGNGWYHYVIPKIDFTDRINPGINWENVNSWFLFGENADVAYGDVNPGTINIMNICATAGYVPSMPENAVVTMDQYGVDCKMGATLDGLWYAARKQTDVVDFSSAEYIEFDLKSDEYNELIAKGKEYYFSFCLNSDVGNTGGEWIKRHYTYNLVNYEIGAKNGWHHFRIPIVDLQAEEGADWTNKNFWMFGFWSGGGVDSGKLASTTFSVMNICGTVAPNAPAAPEGATVLDVPFKKRLGDNVNYSLFYGYDWFRNIVTTTADYSTANFIEFDLFFEDYNAFENHLKDNALDYRFNICSNGVWAERSLATNILQYGKDIGNGWRHYTIPKSAFTNGSGADGGVNWGRVNCWYLMADGADAINKALGSIYSDILIMANICGTVTATEISDIDVPVLPSNTVATIDISGAQNTLGNNYVELWDRVYNKIAVTDLYDAEYIEFDLKTNNYARLKELDAEQALTLSLISIFSNTNDKWANRNSAFYILNYETGINGDWHHFRIPKSVFNYTIGDFNWSNVDFWMIGFQGGKNEATTDVDSAININIKNLCGTSDAPKVLDNAVVTMDKSGATAQIGDEYTWLWQRLYKSTATTDFSSADYIEFDLYSDRYNEIKAVDADRLLTLALVSDYANTNNSDAKRHCIFGITKYEVSSNGDWHHFRVPLSDFWSDPEGASWTNKDFLKFGFWSAYDENGVIPTDTLKDISITFRNLCGTTYDLSENGYTVADGYAITTAGTQISAITTATDKVFAPNGTQVESGVVSNGMIVKFIANGWVYDQATLVIDNDIDGDGAVSATDLVIAKKFYFGVTTASTIQNVAFTGSETATPSIIDFIQMRKALLG